MFQATDIQMKVFERALIVAGRTGKAVFKQFKSFEH